MEISSPNTNIQPLSATVNDAGHLVVGGCDAVELGARFGTPLWIMDEATIIAAAEAVKAGLKDFPQARALYAGKAFLCLSMCHLVRRLGMGLDVVSQGELHTAATAGFPPELIYMHGNNKSEEELRAGLAYGDVNIVVDSDSELTLVAEIAAGMGRRAKVLLRVTPGVEPDTHHYIKTGQTDSKFGLPLGHLPAVAARARGLSDSIELTGLHAHIGSQAQEIGPYLEIIEILADCFQELARSGIALSQLDLGGGIGIKYTEADAPVPLFDWSKELAETVTRAFNERSCPMPMLLLEPGRAIAGTAGVTLYRAGHEKTFPGGARYVAVDGGMADNPRPVTYQARYTAAVANRMREPRPERPVTIVGRYCESGDIIIKDVYVGAGNGDLVAVFGTGAYNYSMASNYNRTGRPACVLVSDGQAEVIIERESLDDLIRHDRVPDRLLPD